MRPELFHSAAALLLTLLLTGAILWLVRRPGWYVAAAAWLAAVNLATFAFYGFDKYRARGGGRRAAEKSFPVGAARLVEVHVRIDQTGQDVQAAGIHHIVRGPIVIGRQDRAH